jgi:hypothetical protein
MKLVVKIIEIMESKFSCSLPYLYRYVKLDSAKRFLENHCLYLANPLKYNDPYEGQVNVVGTSSDEKKYKYLKNTLEPILGEYGVTCFSTSCDNILMWAYYADDQKGICIEFDPSKDDLVFDNVRPISYKENLPALHVHTEMPNIDEILTTKSVVWQHEHEYRIIKKGMAECLITMNPQAIKSIILGCNSAHFYDEEDKNAKIILDIFEILKRPEYEHVKIQQIQVGIDRYRLSVAEVPFFVCQKGNMIEIVSLKHQVLHIQTDDDNPIPKYHAIAYKWERVVLDLDKGKYCIMNDTDKGAIRFEYK